MSEFEEGLATGLLLGDGGGTIISKTFTQNGTYYAIADAVDGYDPVIVDVPIASKSITKNGIYYAVDDDLRGFDPVNVNVPMHWTFQPGEAVPPSMITQDTRVEEDAPPSSEDVPYPTPEDPQRVIHPQFIFTNNGRIHRKEDGQYMSSYGGQLKDADTGEVLEEFWTGHPWPDPNEKFIIDSWSFSEGVFRVGFHYNWYDPGVIYYDTFYITTNVGNYTASNDSGQNTTSVEEKLPESSDST